MSRFSRISRVEVTGSTNEDIARILGEEDARGLTLVADYQERGSGRKGRSWVAPPGSALLCTIALPDPVPSPDLWIVPLWIANVVHAALAANGVETLLKWPNDVLAGGKKLAGILCISRVLGDYAWSACGIGMNVRRPADEAAFSGLESPPAFVSDFAPVDRDALLRAILEQADEQYDELTNAAQVMRDWERLAQLPGARYRILIDGEQQPFDATALRLLPGGALLVDRDGVQQTVSLADARVLR